MAERKRSRSRSRERFHPAPDKGRLTESLERVRNLGLLSPQPAEGRATRDPRDAEAASAPRTVFWRNSAERYTEEASKRWREITAPPPAPTFAGLEERAPPRTSGGDAGPTRGPTPITEDAVYAAEIQLGGSGVDRTNALAYMSSDPSMAGVDGHDLVALGVLVEHAMQRSDAYCAGGSPVAPWTLPP